MAGRDPSIGNTISESYHFPVKEAKFNSVLALLLVAGLLQYISPHSNTPNYEKMEMARRKSQKLPTHSTRNRVRIVMRARSCSATNRTDRFALRPMQMLVHVATDSHPKHKYTRNINKVNTY
jgi:hypothetical protein